MIGQGVCLRFQSHPACALDTYIASGGYQALKNIIQQQVAPDTILHHVEAAGLLGRGGAWFATAVKWRFLETHPQAYLVINSEESEPGTCKDTLILTTNPHQVLEGMIIAAYALGIKVVYHYIRSENKKAYDIMERARDMAYAAGYIGASILGSSFHVDMYNIRGSGGYVAGEETAMLESIEGKRPMPRRKPPFPAHSGLFGRPTVVHNTETIASLPWIMLHGAQPYRALGCGNAVGMKIFSVSGHVKKPGVFELPMGTPFEDILQLAGGMRSDYALKAIIPGGTSMKILPASKTQGLTMDPEGIKAAGSSLGTGGIIVMDESTCMVKALAVMMNFYHHESCGQCTPCREGSAWIVLIMRRILEGQGKPEDIDRLCAIGRGIEGRTLCAFGEAVAWPLLSIIQNFKEEFDYFVAHGVSRTQHLYGKDGFALEDA